MARSFTAFARLLDRTSLNRTRAADHSTVIPTNPEESLTLNSSSMDLEQVIQSDLIVTDVIWGFSLACALFTAIKAVQQSWRCYRRGKLWRNAYIIMVWAEWAVCIIICVLSWLFLHGVVRPGFGIFFGVLCLWVIQVQCIVQNIINRVRLLMSDDRRAEYLKWSVAIFIGLINISVFIIWIPARLQISLHWMDINNIWDWAEKAIFAAADTGLNALFVHLVRTTMVANGLHKYKQLFWFNLCMTVIFVLLDVSLASSMKALRAATVFTNESLIRHLDWHHVLKQFRRVSPNPDHRTHRVEDFN
jgi:multisubunit Na+/H+ antiporter MnhB subunit